MKNLLSNLESFFSGLQHHLLEVSFLVIGAILTISARAGWVSADWLSYIVFLYVSIFAVLNIIANWKRPTYRWSFKFAFSQVEKKQNFWVGIKSRIGFLIHNKWEMGLLACFVCLFICCMTTNSKFMLFSFEIDELSQGIFLAYLALFAARRIASANLSSTLLSRFNSDEFYSIRRKCWKEVMMWFAGDRYLVTSHLLREFYPLDLGLKSSEKDRTISFTQVLGFVAELQEYYLRGLVPRAIAKRLFDDRLCWFVAFFDDVKREFEVRKEAIKEKESQERVGQEVENRRLLAPELMQLYPPRYVPVMASTWVGVSAVDWIKWAAKLLEFNSWKTRFPENDGDPRFRSGPIQLNPFEAPDDCSSDGLKLNQCKNSGEWQNSEVIYRVDTKDQENVSQSFLTFRRLEYEVRVSRGTPDKPTHEFLRESVYALQIGICPMGGRMNEFVELLVEPKNEKSTNEVNPLGGSSLAQMQPDVNAARYWMLRFVYQSDLGHGEDSNPQESIPEPREEPTVQRQESWTQNKDLLLKIAKELDIPENLLTHFCKQESIATGDVS